MDKLLTQSELFPVRTFITADMYLHILSYYARHFYNLQIPLTFSLRNIEYLARLTIVTSGNDNTRSSTIVLQNSILESQLGNTYINTKPTSSFPGLYKLYLTKS